MASTKTQKIMLQKLRLLYPDAKPELSFHNPYETLIAVMLSAQSTDVQVNKVTPVLFARYPDIASMAAAKVEDVFVLVKSCGFKSKANNIVETCRLLMLRHYGNVPGDMESLIELPGVGRKTANVVLANAFGVPTIAVDTHVFRVSNRLGLATANNVVETERQLQQVIPRADWIAAHHWLIFHGRRVCHARKPDCAACALLPECRYCKVESTKTGDSDASSITKRKRGNAVETGNKQTIVLDEATSQNESSTTRRKGAEAKIREATKGIPGTGNQ